MPTTFHCIKRAGALRPTDQEGLDALRCIEEGNTVKVEMTVPSRRSLKMHRMFFALLAVIGEQIDWNKDQMLTWAKVATGWVDPAREPNTGDVILVPRSISFSRMTQEEFERFFDRAITAALERLLPAGTERDALMAEVNGRLG